jgi:hypothetical protein
LGEVAEVLIEVLIYGSCAIVHATSAERRKRYERFTVTQLFGTEQ